MGFLTISEAFWMVGLQGALVAYDTTLRVLECLLAALRYVRRS
jgi:hypothetical protein